MVRVTYTNFSLDVVVSIHGIKYLIKKKYTYIYIYEHGHHEFELREENLGTMVLIGLLQMFSLKLFFIMHTYEVSLNFIIKISY